MQIQTEYVGQVEVDATNPQDAAAKVQADIDGRMRLRDRMVSRLTVRRRTLEERVLTHRIELDEEYPKSLAEPVYRTAHGSPICDMMPEELESRDGVRYEPVEQHGSPEVFPACFQPVLDCFRRMPREDQDQLLELLEDFVSEATGWTDAELLDKLMAAHEGLFATICRIEMQARVGSPSVDPAVKDRFLRWMHNRAQLVGVPEHIGESERGEELPGGSRVIIEVLNGY
jgi:hypothetical protein